MLTILIGVTMAMGAALFITRARKLPAATPVRWLHRALALAATQLMRILVVDHRCRR